MRRIANYLSFMPTAVYRSLRLGRFDVIVGTSPQFFCAVATAAAAALRRTPWVFELRDLWPESIPAVGAMAPVAAAAAARTARAAAVPPGERRRVRQPGLRARTCRGRAIDPAKLRFVPNGIVPASWQSGSREAGRARLGVAPRRGRWSATSAPIGMAHGLGTVLDAARQLAGTLPRLRFVIVGDGAERAALEARVTALGLDNVTFTGLLPRARRAST